MLNNCKSLITFCFLNKDKIKYSKINNKIIIKIRPKINVIKSKEPLQHKIFSKTVKKTNNKSNPITRLTVCCVNFDQNEFNLNLKKYIKKIKLGTNK